MSTPPALRVFACSTDESLRQWLDKSFRGERFTARSTPDAREIKRFAAAGGVDAVLLDQRLEQPKANQLAPALRRALGDDVVIVLLCTVDWIREPGEAFDASVRLPVGPGVLPDRVVRLHAAKRVDHDRRHRELSADVELRYARLDTQSYYEILGVPPTAPADDITAAYDRLSLRFHPDRLSFLDGTPLEDKALQLYIVIGEAYRALRSRAGRERYDAALAKGELRLSDDRQAQEGPRTLEELGTSPKVKKALRLAQSAIDNDETAMAIIQLRFAASLDPENEEIAAHLAELEAEG